MLNKKDRYLEKIDDGRILVWTEMLAKRKDMREFFPDFDEIEEVDETTGTFEDIEPKEIKPREDGLVTEEFLLTKTKDQLRAYAFDVYGEKLNHLKKPETMVKDILELQQKRNLEE